MGDLRERLRGSHNLVQHWTGQVAMDCYVEKNQANIRHNATVLSPIFKLMAQHGLQPPPIDRLQEQVGILLMKYHNKKGEELAYQQAWAIRRLCSCMKATIYKPQPPKELPS